MNEVHPLLTLLAPSIAAFNTAFDKLMNDIEPIAHGCKADKLKTILTMYSILDNLKDQGAALTKVCNIIQPDLAERANKIMINEDMDEVTFDGIKYTPASKTYVSVNKGDQEALIQWLKTHPTGKELVCVTVNANSLTSFINELLSEGYSKDSKDAETRIPSFVSTFDKETIKTKAVKK